ncbi:MAG: sugar ABC transporter permease, partial [Planctomycetaceae bacterium]|nr:sugar ABC transporter permease [Planctomycetaceae bacterium]
MIRSSRRRLATGLLFISPWLAGFVLLTGFPFAASLWWSFCRYDLLSPPQWVGAANYQRLLSEVAGGTGFGEALWNTAYYGLLAVPGSIVLGIGLAVLLTQRIRGQAVYRTVFFLPSIVPSVASSILWMWLLDPKKGLVNRALAPAGVQPGWFNSSAELFSPAAWLAGTAGAGAKEGLVLMSLWGLGNFIVIYL